MKRLLPRAGVLAILLAVPAALPAANAQSVIGRWNTQKQGGIVEIHRCGEALCGRVVDGAPLRANPDQRDVNNPNKALRDRKLLGARVLHGFTGGPRVWKGGPVYDPETGDGANSGVLTLADANTLKVKGCIAAFLCRTQTWKRVR
ncbi:DUF2147 domain-containing protein [Sphingomonas suaedae]|uniref:DUF2147 domain-containing protein n=1 Tax=Sphingomonas suaedae TaxID=2599297 RepID=A0A518RG88_9SPHN|nr:DUF2147 domain-containing protein [Sphingomonas suaedae]QDX26472.1 DUF2147 domain-containing protein [Sphingomonas suaedae]